MSDQEKISCHNEIVCNLAKSSLLQARKSHSTYVEMSEIMLAHKDGDDEFNRQALEFARRDADANFDFAIKILDVTNTDEVVKLQKEHTARQSQVMQQRLAALKRGEPETTEADSPARPGAAEAAAAIAAATGAAAAGAAGAAGEQNDSGNAGEAPANAEVEAKDVDVEAAGGVKMLQPRKKMPALRPK